MEHIERPALLLVGLEPRHEVRHALAGAEAVVADLERAQRGARERARAGAEQHRVVRIEIEVVVVLEIGAAPADEAEMALADLGGHAAAEKSARRILDRRHHAAERHLRRVLVAEPQLLEFLVAPVKADPPGMRVAIAAQVEVVGIRLVRGAVVRRRKFVRCIFLRRASPRRRARGVRRR